MDGIEQESRADLIKVGVIQYIRGLRAKLDVHRFSYFEERCVPAPRPWDQVSNHEKRCLGRMPPAGGSLNKDASNQCAMV